MHTFNDPAMQPRSITKLDVSYVGSDVSGVSGMVWMGDTMGQRDV